ncbi:MAG: C40 family peptidase [Calditrichaeota bacterium]|nr:C40 family peptidase [Calditrichota bacterium]
MALVIRQFLGAPYVWGGTSPQGVDCSGLVVAVYSQTFGMDLPHSAAALFRMGSPVSRRRLRFGDLVFFSTKGGPGPEHVGIYLGKGVFVHASTSQGVVVERLDRPYFKRRWVGARRLVSF